MTGLGFLTDRYLHRNLVTEAALAGIQIELDRFGAAHHSAVDKGAERRHYGLAGAPLLAGATPARRSSNLPGEKLGSRDHGPATERPRSSRRYIFHPLNNAHQPHESDAVEQPKARFG